MKKESDGSTEAIGEKDYRRGNVRVFAVMLLAVSRMCATDGVSVSSHRKNPKLERRHAHLLITTERTKQLHGGGSPNETSLIFVNRRGSKRTLFGLSEALSLDLEHWTKAAPFL